MVPFSLKIISIDRVFFDGECLQIQMPTPSGSRGVLAHHSNAVVGISTGELRIQTLDGEWQTAVTGTGYARIGHNKVMMIVDTCERPEEIDERRAMEAKERAEEQLRQKQSVIEFRHSQASLARAMVRLKVKRNINN